MSFDDRITCLQCSRLNPGGRCLAKQIFPVKSLLQRCEHYVPKPGQVDMRSGEARGWVAAMFVTPLAKPKKGK